MKKTQSIVTRATARALILHGENILLLFRQKIDAATGEISQYYTTIGGGIEGDETVEQALARELEEEVGIKDFSIVDKICIYRDNQTHEGVTTQYTTHLYLVQNNEGHYRNPHEGHGPEAQKQSLNNHYRITKIDRDGISSLNLKPIELKNIILTYGIKKGYIDPTHNIPFNL